MHTGILFRIQTVSSQKMLLKISPGKSWSFCSDNSVSSIDSIYIVALENLPYTNAIWYHHITVTSRELYYVTDHQGHDHWLFNMFDILNHIVLRRVVSYRIVLHRITSDYIISSYIISYIIISHRIASHHRITSYHVTSHHITSHHHIISPHHIISYNIILYYTRENNILWNEKPSLFGMLQNFPANDQRRYVSRDGVYTMAYETGCILRWPL